MEESMNDVSLQSVQKALQKNFAFQRKWQTINMVAYLCTTVGTVGCTTGATLAGAWNDARTAAILAGIATFLVTVEKSLMFREKWKLHLNIVTQLEQIQLGLLVHALLPRDAYDQMGTLLNQYASELPIAPRE